MTSQPQEIDRLRLEIEKARMLLHSTASTESAKEDCVESVMLHLEEFASAQPALACGLMTALWPVADELRMHHVCDGIDLWIINNQSPALLAHLRSLSAAESDADLKRHWDGLISNF